MNRIPIPPLPSLPQLTRIRPTLRFHNIIISPIVLSPFPHNRIPVRITRRMDDEPRSRHVGLLPGKSLRIAHEFGASYSAVCANKRGIHGGAAFSYEPRGHKLGGMAGRVR